MSPYIKNNLYSRQHEVYVLVGYYAAYSGNSLPTFRNDFWSHFQRSRNIRRKISGPLRMEQTGSAETSVRNYHYSRVMSQKSVDLNYIAVDAWNQSSQHCSLKAKSTATNLVTYLDLVSPLAISQRQVDSIYSDLNCAFDPVSHLISLHRRCTHGLSDGYWFHRYFTDRQSSVGIFDTLSLTFWRRNYFFLILAHPVYKMWIIQETNTLELWNKQHFEEKKRRVYTMFKIFSTYICWINI